MNLENNYSDKIKPLFELGREPLMKQFDPNAYNAYDFESKDIDELLQLALDTSYYGYDYETQEKESDRFFYATIHAVRVLTILKAKESIKPIFEFKRLEDLNDFLESAFVDLLAWMDEDALPIIESIIKKYTNSDELISIFDGLGNMLERFPERFRLIEPMLLNYIRSKDLDPTSLGFAISLLTDHTTTEHLELIRDTFNNREVDFMVEGDLEDIEIKIGVRKERSTPRPKNQLQQIMEEAGVGGFDEFQALINEKPHSSTIVNTQPKIGRNDPCPCGSGKKYKKCCMDK